MAVLIGKVAPEFTSTAVMADNAINTSFNLLEYLTDNNKSERKICVLFFYPLNFSFVCPTEIIAFDQCIEEFEKRDVKVIGVSVDSPYSHIIYKSTDIKSGGIGPIRFPLIADLSKDIAKAYDVLANNSVAFRGTFLIDQQGIVRHQVINDLPLGRSVHEILRVVDALIHNQTHGDVCPANWQEGEESINPTQKDTTDYLAKKYGNETSK